MNKIELLFLIIIFLIIVYFTINKKEDFVTDVEAIANVAGLYNSGNFQVDNMKVSKNLNVSGDINLQGRIFTNGKTNLPNGWGGGLRVFDIYGDGTLGWGDENLNMNSYINRSEALFPKLLVGGQNVIENFNIINRKLNNLSERCDNLEAHSVLKNTAYRIQNNNSGSCMYSRDRDLNVWGCDDENIQKWQIIQ